MYTRYTTGTEVIIPRCTGTVIILYIYYFYDVIKLYNEDYYKPNYLFLFSHCLFSGFCCSALLCTMCKMLLVIPFLVMCFVEGAYGAFMFDKYIHGRDGGMLKCLICDGYRVEDAVDDMLTESSTDNTTELGLILASLGGNKDAAYSELLAFVCSQLPEGSCDGLPPRPVIGTLAGWFNARAGYDPSVVIECLCTHHHDCPDEEYGIEQSPRASLRWRYNRLVDRRRVDHYFAAHADCTENCLYSNKFYKEYANDVYSQHGEDGVIAELLRRIGVGAAGGWTVEFGAWNGTHLSNTFHLVEQGFRGVFIEGDPERFLDLLATTEKHPGMLPINSFVDPLYDDPNSLDHLLWRTPVPIDFDVLSIDIDSYDYHVWKSTNYRPKIVVIEINAIVPTDVTDYIYDLNDTSLGPTHLNRRYQMTSFRPMLELGRSKGYTFVLHTFNMIFVRDDLYPRLGLSYKDPLENFRADAVGVL